MNAPQASDQASTSGNDRGRRRGLLLTAVVLVALVTMGITALLINILERKQEGQEVAFKVANVTDTTEDPAVWGQNFPLQYQAWLKTTEMIPTKHGGSKAVQVTQPDGTKRTATVSRIETDPRLVKMWAGYPFSVDYREARGHGYMLEDQRLTLRVKEFKQPGACLNCHASTYTIMKDLGKGDLNAGFAAMNKMPYTDATKLAKHPVACIDCHDPATMELRITRPAFIEGIKAAKAAQGVKDYDVNKDASPQEMRSFVCGQCHVEYYFKGDAKTLTFPWSKGLKIDQIYTASADHVDFVHKTTGTKILKAQHPEFDLWQQGVHADAGVSCADCHMPYKREGAVKVSDHQIRSPLLSINNSCQGCHSPSEAQLKARVETIQDRFVHTRDIAMDSLMALVGDLEKAQQNGTPAARIEIARSYHRKASFYIDYVYSENSYGFHAPGETLRILGDAIDAARKGQLALTGAVTTPAPDTPDQAGPVPPATPTTAPPATKPAASAGPASASSTR